jgi:predicted phosphoadenosine phosphosulfate sulfurtransferase
VIEQLLIACLRRYPNRAIPSLLSPISAASESSNAASINRNAAKEDPKHWREFRNFLLQRMTHKTAEDRLRYAQQYGKVLETGNASDLLSLQPDKRIHAMKALELCMILQGDCMTVYINHSSYNSISIIIAMLLQSNHPC